MVGKQKKGILAAVICILLAAGCFAWYQHELAVEAEKSSTLTLSGNVDVREVAVAFRASDRIAEILVDEGDSVREGQVLARLDDRELQLSLNKARAQAKAQQSYVDKLHNGTRSEEIQQAQANYQAAQAAARNASGIYARYRNLYDNIEGISAQQLDNALHDMQAKAAAAEAAEHALDKAVNGSRPEDIAAGEAELQAAQEELSRQEYVLSQYELRAPADGVIRSRLLQPGDMAAPSAPVFKLSLLNRKWVRAYVPETDLGKLYEGQAAYIKIDSQEEMLSGQIGYISATAEFTPKNVQTEELRTALVYEVRIYVDDADNVLRLGMPATVKINL